MAKKSIDWDRGRRLYRIGQLTDQEIADVIGCKRNTVTARAKREGWARDLSSQVAQAMRARLTAGDGVTDEEAVEDAANQAAEVVRGHRNELKTGRQLIVQMFGEMAAVGHAPDEIKEALRSSLDEEKFDIEAILGALSLPSRSKSMSQLAASLAKIVDSERKAWNLDEHNSEKPYEKMLLEVINEDEADEGEGSD